MLSVIKTFAADKALFLGFAHLLLILSLGLCGVRGSSLREHRLRGSEADSDRENPGRLTPNADMLKALQYIESLHQRTSAQQRPSFPARFDVGHVGDAEKLRAVLRLASKPVQSDGDGEDEGEEREDKSEELLQAVLSTLQQTDKAANPLLLRPGVEEPQEGAYPRAQQKQRGIRPHEKLPLMFEDEEEGERDEEDEDPDLEQESPFKRTNENVEEKYTPQNLATLQSVFDELDKLTSAKSVNKRQDEEDEAEEDEEEDGDGDMFDVRNVAYDGAGGDAAEWRSLAEQEEEEGEEGDKPEAGRGLDYINDGEEHADEDEEEEDGGSFPAKRSDDPDDVANMVDYYLLKVLENTEEEQKRELEEEELERAERRAAQWQYRDGIDPRAVYQLLHISQKYQIPPENLLDMLNTGEMANQNKPSKTGKSSRAQDRLSQMFSRKKQKIPEAPFYNRRFHSRQKTPEEQRTEQVLNILGLRGGDSRAPLRKEQQYRSSLSRLRARPAGRQGEPSPTQQRRPGTSKGSYDDGADEDELAAYLAAQMLAQFPQPTHRNNKAGQKRDDGRSLTDSLEQAVQDYLDQMDSDKSLNEKRRSEDEERGGGTQAQAQGLDSEEVMKLLSFLDPEDDDSGADAKTNGGI
ncbi:secretogranin-2b [Takifugu flavidus]|uniref:Secretogranin-2 Secretogranin II n=1 Tax=Takifugu flavidus TaxID=433684 RepID=A0A5C6PDU0_9TELE|nr:secretogranin-2b [Takifugu flavidus]TWW76758.1 Secretogranin-2 Secretogranin II [Takifugu flavidus]